MDLVVFREGRRRWWPRYGVATVGAVSGAREGQETYGVVDREGRGGADGGKSGWMLADAEDDNVGAQDVVMEEDTGLLDGMREDGEWMGWEGGEEMEKMKNSREVGAGGGRQNKEGKEEREGYIFVRK